jgi:hypothetical protein
MYITRVNNSDDSRCSVKKEKNAFFIVKTP